jgi:hypothetical protein
MIFFIFFCGQVSAAEKFVMLDHDSVNWTRLVYEASAFFMTLESEVNLKTIPSDTATKQLTLNDGVDVLSPKGDKVFHLQNYAEGFGKKTYYTLWFNSDGESLQRKKLVRGKKNEIKIYRYAPCGYYTLRHKFNSKKFDANFSQWKESDASFTEFPRELCDSGKIFDVNSLLYLISALNIKNVGYERELLTFSRGKLITVRITAKKMETIYSDYKINSSSGTLKINDDINVLKVQVTPLTSNRKDLESFKFLGLKGKVNVFIDTSRQLIVRLSGKVDVVGKININLKHAELSRP